MSKHRDMLRSEARKAAYRDTRQNRFNPSQFEDLRQQEWYVEKYHFIKTVIATREW